jgi:hypothetical protein
MQVVNCYTRIRVHEMLVKLLTVAFSVSAASLVHLGMLTYSEQIDPSNFELVKGPFGALAILFGLTIIFGRLIMWMQKRNDVLRDKIEKMKDEQIQDLKDRLNER